MTDRLRPHWDFDDLDATEGRLSAALAGESSDEGRAEVMTQLARVEGLRSRVEEGDRLLETADTLAGESAIVAVRVALERGRLRRSSGDPEVALPLFEEAYARAREARLWFLAADAAHMAALATGGGDGFVVWTRLGIALAEEHAEASYWAGPLLNNLGWELLETGEPEAALDAFERALEARRSDTGNPSAIAIAQYALGRALRSLGRAAEAIPFLEQAVAWAEGVGAPDGWFYEELAEEYADVGLAAEARDRARAAIPLLEASDPSFTGDDGRSARLRVLAGTDPLI